MNLKRNPGLVRLFSISFVSLFAELLFIRWIPDAVHILSFFGNFILLSIFLGMGIGLAIPLRETDENIIVRRIFINFVVLSVVIIFFDMISFGVSTSQDYHFNEDLFRYTLKLNIYFIVGLFVLITTYAFIPVGYMISLYFANQKPLAAYSVNIGGSLLGILVFSLFCSLSTPVWIWLACALLPLLVFTRARLKYLLIIVLIVFSVISASFYNQNMSKGRKIWSPYYCLRVFTPNSDHAYIIIGNSFLLSALNFEKPGDNKMFRFICDYLEAPYRFVKNPEKVLVLGAGMGNDVAYALKMGAGHVDAVEIDPVIIELGKKYHPNRPYADGRVTIICNDARTYTRNTRNKYDLIVYGTLDSHGLFSQISSLKMENYVYTLESFRESRRLLKPGGILYVNVGYEALFVRFRLFNCLKEAFGRAPHLYLSQSSLMMYICDETGSTEGENEGEFTYKELKISDEKLRSQIPESYTIPTDDWPHLFLKEKKIPSEYLFALLILFLISAFYVSFYFKLRGSPSVKYFFLGAGFMLLETKSITEMGLVFGSTWIVNSVVIASILLIILMVNLFLLKYEKLRGLYWAYLFLGLALILSYLFPLSCLSISGFAPRLFLAFLYISLPVLFAALIFAVNFREAGEKASFYLASNMLGSVAGGIIEYASMIFGLKALYLCALFVYLVSMLAMIRENRVSASGALKEIPS